MIITRSGRKIFARHRFFTDWLTEAGVDPETAERDACRMEHAISEDSFRKLMAGLERTQKVSKTDADY